MTCEQLRPGTEIESFAGEKARVVKCDPFYFPTGEARYVIRFADETRESYFGEDSLAARFFVR
jgi:hypothetical protein